MCASNCDMPMARSTFTFFHGLFVSASDSVQADKLGQLKAYWKMTLGLLVRLRLQFDSQERLTVSTKACASGFSSQPFCIPDSARHRDQFLLNKRSPLSNIPGTHQRPPDMAEPAGGPRYFPSLRLALTQAKPQIQRRNLTVNTNSPTHPDARNCALEWHVFKTVNMQGAHRNLLNGQIKDGDVKFPVIGNTMPCPIV